MRGFVIFLGLLLILGGGAVAGAQFAPIDLSIISAFYSVPGSRDFLATPMALYAGGGAAGVGLLLVIIAAATGGRKRERAVVTPPSPGAETSASRKPKQVAKPASSPTPVASKPAPEPQPVAAAPAPRPVAPAPPPPAPPKPPAPLEPQPVAAAPQPPQPLVSPAPQTAPTPPPEAKAKPQASSQPPAGAAVDAAPVPAAAAPPPDPRLINRKRVQDLVTINDALKAFYARNGAYPKAEGLAGANERGAAWIPGLSPDFLAQLPRDPAHGAATQYVYVSDGANYKLIAQGASLVGSGNVEVLGVKIDPTRNPTQQSASFGFWTPPFAGA